MDGGTETRFGIGCRGGKRHEVDPIALHPPPVVPLLPRKFCARHVPPPDGIPSVDCYKFPLLFPEVPSFSFFLSYLSPRPSALLRSQYQVIHLGRSSFKQTFFIYSPLDRHYLFGASLGSLSTSLPCLCSTSFKQDSAMATQRQYNQPAAAPMSIPSKTPGPANLYPVSRLSGSPPDISDTSTTAGSRTSGFSFNSGSISGDYESSAGSLSGVDVVDVLNDRMQETFDPTPMDRGLAKQAQT